MEHAENKPHMPAPSSAMASTRRNSKDFGRLFVGIVTPLGLTWPYSFDAMAVPMDASSMDGRDMSLDCTGWEPPSVPTGSIWSPHEGRQVVLDTPGVADGVSRRCRRDQ